MAVQLDVATRNARLDAIETTNGASCYFRVKSGAQPASCATAEAGSTLVGFNLPADWMAAAGSGAKAKNGTWSGTASGTGTPGHCRLYNSQVTMDETTCFLQADAAVGSGSLNFDGTITSGQTVTISQFTLTDGNA